MSDLKRFKGAQKGDDKIRCPWPYYDDPLMIQYHDEEWGRPCHDDRMLYEMFVIELFQAGLSWRTLLHKRENFREAYDHLDLHKVAEYGEDKIQSLMQELGLFDLVPAMCRLDYTMSEAGGASRFVREHTIAEGDSYCDCGYKKRTS